MHRTRPKTTKSMLWISLDMRIPGSNIHVALIECRGRDTCAVLDLEAISNCCQDRKLRLIRAR